MTIKTQADVAFEKKVFSDSHLWETGKLGRDIRFAKKSSNNTKRKVIRKLAVK